MRISYASYLDKDEKRRSVPVGIRTVVTGSGGYEYELSYSPRSNMFRIKYPELTTFHSMRYNPHKGVMVSRREEDSFTSTMMVDWCAKYGVDASIIADMVSAIGGSWKEKRAKKKAKIENLQAKLAEALAKL